MPGASFAPIVSTDQSGTAQAEAALLQPSTKPVISAAGKGELPPGMIVTAKHLCGGGTDVALRSLQYAQHPGAKSPACHRDAGVSAGMASGGEGVETSSGSVPPLVGLVMATCCHHGCAWSTYVGTTWWEGTAHLTPLHFAVAAWASSWQAGSWSSVLQRTSGAPHESNAAHSWLGQLPVPGVDELASAVENVGAACADAGGQVQAESRARCTDASPTALSAQPSVVPAPDGTEHTLQPNAEQAAMGALAGELQHDDVHKMYIGRVCKRLIDAGREHFVQNELVCAGNAGDTLESSTAPPGAHAGNYQGFQPAACQVCYCSGHLTLENVALVAHSTHR